MAITVDNMAFHWADYLVFVLALLLSTLIGVYFGFVEKKQKTTQDFLVGGKEMSPIPVALSVLASFLSAPAIIGTPTEVYYFGTVYGWVMIGYIFSTLICAHGFVPVFHRMQVTSAYEYLEARYSRTVRWIGSLTFALMMLLYMGVSIYAPAAAFSQVTGLNMYLSVLGVGIICTFYTSVGGMKAVVWTDVIQMSIMILGILVLVIMGGLEIGSISKIANIVNNGTRWHWLEFSPDPRIRYSFWTGSVGMFFIATSLLGSNQAMIQRYLSIKKCRDAQKAVYYALITIIIFTILVLMMGCVMFAYYQTCDPIAFKSVSSPDQIVPYFVMQIFGRYHGLPGLFSAAVFSATLSTVSSGLNAMSAVFLVDFIQPIYHWKTGLHLRERIATIVSKLISVVMGAVTIGIAYVAPFMGTTVLQIGLSVFGMVGGPLCGLFSLAIFVPWSNKWGALVGIISGLIFSFWLSIGAILNKAKLKILPLRVDGCPFPGSGINNVTIMSYVQTTSAFTSTADFTTATESPAQQPMTEDEFVIYHTSFMWYAMYAILVTLIMGCLVSALTGFNRGVRQPANMIYNYPELCGCCCRGRCLKVCLGEPPLEEKTEIHVINGSPKVTKASANVYPAVPAGPAFTNPGYDVKSDTSHPPGGNQVAPEENNIEYVVKL